MNDPVSKFISVTIDRTKQNQLHWISLVHSKIRIKPNKSFDSLDPDLIKMYENFELHIEEERSYVTQYNNGEIFLVMSIDYSQTDPYSIELIVPPQSSKYSVLYASTTNEDFNVSSELKRLYNIVDSSDPDVSQFINSFIQEQ